MGKKILVISSSPRRQGNSDSLCNAFITGAKEAGNTVKKVFLADQKINYCQGCGLCVEKQGTCSQHDDMEAIKEDMLDADVIVFGTPIYFYAMSAQMKTLIDRCCCFYTLLNEKEFYYIMTAADNEVEAMNRAIEEFRGFTDCLEHPAEKGILCGIGVFKKGEVQEKDIMNDAYEMGRQVGEV